MSEERFNEELWKAIHLLDLSRTRAWNLVRAELLRLAESKAAYDDLKLKLALAPTTKIAAHCTPSSPPDAGCAFEHLPAEAIGKSATLLIAE